MKQKIAIAGAGPAGSSLAIRLAKTGFDVTLIERETFPRQKLCGEFISPECLEHFADLGVLGDLTAAGGDRIRETAFFSAAGRSVTVPSAFLGNGDALSLSRSEMDHRLVQMARSVGVRVIEDAYVCDISADADGSTSGLQFRREGGAIESVDAELLIDATGRTAALARLLSRSSGSNMANRPGKPPFVAFKTHLRHSRVGRGRCEIYFFDGGYGGVSNVEGGLANLCFLVRSSIVREFRGDADEIVRRVVMSNARANETLAIAEPAREWIAVPLSRYGRKDLNPAPGVFCIGDAAAFIDPFTGSGMLLALESSNLLFQAIVAAGPQFPAAIAARYVDAHRRAFDSRLRTAWLLRRAAFVPFLAGSAIRAASANATLTEMLARFTRRRAMSALNRR